MAEQVPHAYKPDIKHVHDERDLCPCREEERAKYFSEGCNKFVCSKCSSGHIDQDEKKLHQITDEISSLRGQIEHQINKLEGFGEGLKAKEKEMAATEKELCDKIDIQVQNVCDEATRIGKKIKDNVKKTHLHDEENASSATSDTINIKKLMEDNKTALEDLKASMETCSNFLKEGSSLPTVERLNQLRQEVNDFDSSKMVIPDVLVMEIVAGEIDRDMLSKQVGRLVSREGMVEVWFDVNGISEKGEWSYSREIQCVGKTWRVGACRKDNGDVWIDLQGKQTPQGVKSCKVDRYIKLVNIKDDHQSLDKHIKKRQKSCFPCCKWDQFIDKETGFINDKNQFKIQAKLTILE